MLQRFQHLQAFVERHAVALLVAWLMAAVGLALLARKLELRTDLTELLPSDHPAVVAMREVSPRQRSASSLVVLLDGDAKAVAAYADAARPALEQLVPRVLTQIDWGPDPEPAAFAHTWRWLYAPLPQLAEVEQLADALVAKRTSPFYVDVDEDPAAGLARLEREMNEKLPSAPASERFVSHDGRTVGIRMWRKREGLGGAGDHATLTAVQSALDALPHTGIRIRYTGPIAQAVEEQAAIRDDLSFATLACATLILLALWLAFGRGALVLAALWPTVLGLLVALALAGVALGSLNLNTAFLVSIILGNGINGPIVLIAELGRQRRTHPLLRDALPRAMVESGRGIVAAMLSAAAAYAVLGVTRFRGFRQFGLIGGVGMIAVLIATFTALPPLLVLLERRGWLSPGRDRFSPPVVRAVRALGRCARPIAYVITAVSIAGAVLFARSPIEWNLRTLRSRGGEASAAWPDMEKLGMGSVGAGYIANTAVLLVEDPHETERVAAALRAGDTAHQIATVRTLDSLLPSDQADKLAALARLRALVDRQLSRHGSILSDDERKRLASARPPEGLRAITVDDLPRAVRDAFTEIDGTRGRLVGIDAIPSYRDWDGHALLRMARSLSTNVDGKTYTAASASTIFAGMLSTLVADAPRLAGLALVSVLVLLALAFGRRALGVIGSLLLGLLWLVGAAGLFGIRLNFMSFAALPISIGVGADYAANLATRDEDGPAATIVLCSLTTVIGYSSLLLGHNGALRSFGLLCDVGEVTCLLAAVLVMSMRRRS